MTWWYENEEEKMEDKELDERIKEMGVELKPCPFCGGEPEAWVDKRDSVPVYYIECSHNIEYKCGVSLITVPVASLERAVELWNTRATEQKAENSCKDCELSLQEADDLICTKDGRKVFQPTACCGDFSEQKAEKEDNMWNYKSLPERQENGVSDHVIVAVEGCPYGQSGYYDYDLQAWFVDGCSEPVKVEAWQKVELPKIEKAEKKEMCLNCKHYNKVNDFRDCTLVDNPTCACPHYEAEKHYRPFKDTDELIKVWVEKTKPYRVDTRIPPLIMPLIWVREKGCEKSADLITCFGSKGITVRGKEMYFDTLFEMFEFLDGSPCGVAE